MNLFLDANVALAACGRPVGASRAIFDAASQNGWKLMTSGYALAEVSVNLPRLGPIATQEWARLRRQLLTVRDVWTLDRRDFGAVMGGRFYGLDVLTPGDFLERERSGGRLK